MSVKKDFAVLFNIQAWLTSTAEMDADARGWYLNLILHHYDKGDLPSDTEGLALLAGVKFSEYERFKHVLEHVLSKKLVLNLDTGRLENRKAINVLTEREQFLDKRVRAGRIGAITTKAKSIKGYYKHKKEFSEYLNKLDDNELLGLKDIEAIAEVILSFDTNFTPSEPNAPIEMLSFVEPEYLEAFKAWLKHKKDKRQSYKSADSVLLAYNKLKKLSNNNPDIATEIINEARGNNWDGFFALKGNKEAPVKATGKAQSMADQANRVKMEFDNE